MTAQPTLQLFRPDAIGLPRPRGEREDWRYCSGTYRGFPGCGALLPPEIFHWDSKHASFVSTCQPCRQDIDQAIKERDPFWTKADDWLNRHARSRGIPKFELIHVYGLTHEWLADQFRHSVNRGCCYCDTLLILPGEERLGYGNITGDIYDRRLKPYRSNIRIPCCQTCNREKGEKTPEEWAAYLQGRRIRQAHIAATGWTPKGVHLNQELLPLA